jgi:hypothetical protein
MSIQYFATIDAAANINGFYNTDVHLPDQIPVDAVEISEEQWRLFIAEPHRKNGNVWESVPAYMPTLNESKAAKIAELSRQCNATILAGFESNALGTPHFYDFDYEAQTNLGGMLNAITAGIVTESFSWKASGVPTLHTPTQFKSLFGAGLAHKNEQITKYWTLKAQVNSATTKEDVDAVVWS